MDNQQRVNGSVPFTVQRLAKYSISTKWYRKKEQLKRVEEIVSSYR